MENKEANPSLKGPKEVEDGEVSPSINMDQNASKRVLRKIDLHVLPLMMILYFAAFLDRYVLSLHLWYQVETSFQLDIDITQRLLTVGQPTRPWTGQGELSKRGQPMSWVMGRTFCPWTAHVNVYFQLTRVLASVNIGNAKCVCSPSTDISCHLEPSNSTICFSIGCTVSKRALGWLVTSIRYVLVCSSSLTWYVDTSP